MYIRLKYTFHPDIYIRSVLPFSLSIYVQSKQWILHRSLIFWIPILATRPSNITEIYRRNPNRFYNRRKKSFLFATLFVAGRDACKTFRNYRVARIAHAYPPCEIRVVENSIDICITYIYNIYMCVSPLPSVNFRISSIILHLSLIITASLDSKDSK